MKIMMTIMMMMIMMLMMMMMMIIPATQSNFMLGPQDDARK